MRRLYFDIDGTVLVLNSGRAKATLAGGKLERAIRDTGVESLVCVGNFAGVVRTVWEVDPAYDGLGALFALCAGVFEDEAWFRRVTGLVHDPKLRAAEIDRSVDWWYMDDLATRYLSLAGLSEELEHQFGNRILQPDSLGDGTDVIDWLVRLKGSASPA